MSEPLDAFVVAEVIEAELDHLNVARGAPTPRMAAVATVYRLARALADRASDPAERAALIAIADEPWVAAGKPPSP